MKTVLELYRCLLQSRFVWIVPQDLVFSCKKQLQALGIEFFFRQSAGKMWHLWSQEDFLSWHWIIQWYLRIQSTKFLNWKLVYRLILCFHELVLLYMAVWISLLNRGTSDHVSKLPAALSIQYGWVDNPNRNPSNPCIREWGISECRSWWRSLYILARSKITVEDWQTP